MRQKNTLRASAKPVIYFDISSIRDCMQLVCKHIDADKYLGLKGHLYLKLKDGKQAFLKIAVNSMRSTILTALGDPFIGGLMPDPSIEGLEDLIKSSTFKKYLFSDIAEIYQVTKKRQIPIVYY